jgi:hypothetical protein
MSMSARSKKAAKKADAGPSGDDLAGRTSVLQRRMDFCAAVKVRNLIAIFCFLGQEVY